MMGNLVGLLARCWVAGNPYPPGHQWATVVRRTQPHLVGSGYLLVRGKTVRGKAGVSVLGHLSVAPAPLSAHTFMSWLPTCVPGTSTELTASQTQPRFILEKRQWSLRQQASDLGHACAKIPLQFSNAQRTRCALWCSRFLCTQRGHNSSLHLHLFSWKQRNFHHSSQENCQNPIQDSWTQGYLSPVDFAIISLCHRHLYLSTHQRPMWGTVRIPFWCFGLQRQNFGQIIRQYVHNKWLRVWASGIDFFLENNPTCTQSSILQLHLFSWIIEPTGIIPVAGCEDDVGW